jgi:hypothetical protein
MNKIRNAWRSWTIWFNGIMAVTIPALPLLADQIPQMQPFLSPALYQWIGGLIVLANIALRFKTNSSLADK